jgi:RHS repeat-associated protein
LMNTAFQHGDVCTIKITAGERVSSRYHYDEFGVAQDAKKFDVNWPGPDNLFGYTGLGYDYYSGLSYARARYYKPEMGRFISEDTYKGSLWNSQSQNGYAYVENNPLIYTDPSGFKPYAMKIDDNYTILYTGRVIESARNAYGFIPWVGGYLLDGIDNLSGVHDFNSDDVNGAKKILDINNYEGTALDIAGKLGEEYSKTGKKFAKVSGGTF